jgi:hypothetical protein
VEQGGQRGGEGTTRISPGSADISKLQSYQGECK